MHSALLVTSLPGLARPATPPHSTRRPGLDPDLRRGGSPGHQGFQPPLHPGLAARPLPPGIVLCARAAGGRLFQCASQRDSSMSTYSVASSIPSSVVHKEGGEYSCY